MEQASYYVSMCSFAIVMACWFVFAAVILLRKRAKPARDAVNAPTSWIGFALQGLSYLIVLAVPRSPTFSPLVEGAYVLNTVLQAAAALVSIGSVLLAMSAIRELGKQWSLEARLVEGHKLVTTGPYSFVRHPIYTAMLGMLIGTGIVLSDWPVLLVGIAVFLIGTFIRTRFEERLLEDAFGDEFKSWRDRVPGLIPFVRL
jgi:protein-S-isoprenylcysteine O-methyltransferase Ste14